ncbi:MAG: aminoglycoside phosphotransferase family protein [Anaerolineae bacterium]|nr:aminoglycoside phosphotransferase family protein [Anaerolineae bacterium]NUQ02485.1 hypothetical protein [Anaerolineae bacterium]
MSHSDLLSEVQALQFTNKRAAEQLLVPFIRETFGLPVRDVLLRPLAVSLNSFNGYLTLDDHEQLFFKTHIEADNVIDEYYNAELLSGVGYPVLQPLYASQESGRQFLIYPVINCPSVFDAAWDIEIGKAAFDVSLQAAQNRTDDALLQIYEKTLHEQTPAQASSAPIHQLFYHRLTGGRLARFYGEESVIRWAGEAISLEEVRKAHWVVNGRTYNDSLDDLIERAIRLLHPGQGGPAVVGHGDAHNGNLFYCPAEPLLTYFDPAFAGTHHPLLDLVKPIFHNVFAMWMYFPSVIDKNLHLEMKRHGNTWIVAHDYTPHPIRDMFLESKVKRVLTPLLKLLHERGALRKDWRPYLKSALMCCPFLTMNLADANRFSERIALLGLAWTIEAGSSPVVGSMNRIDLTLEQAFTDAMR